MIKDFFKFIRLIMTQKHLILAMAKREVAHRHVGSLLGFVWTFVNPFVLVCVLWMVFNLGFRVKPMEGVSFVVWLAAGLSGWFFFADFVNGAAGIVVSNTHLIKKTLFHSQILPVVKLHVAVLFAELVDLAGNLDILLAVGEDLFDAAFFPPAHGL